MTPQALSLKPAWDLSPAWDNAALSPSHQPFQQTFSQLGEKGIVGSVDLATVTGNA